MSFIFAGAVREPTHPVRLWMQGSPLDFMHSSHLDILTKSTSAANIDS